MSAAKCIEAAPASRDLPTILLVDEHRVTAEIEINYFLNSGFQVLLASTPAEVRSLLSRTPVDLMMIDVSFARNKGLDLVGLAKKVSCNPHLKVLATSVVGLPEVRKRAEAAGADRFLVKPAPRPKVLKEIKALTSQKSRDSERVRQKLSATLTIKGGGTLEVWSLDVSEDGIHLSTAAEKPAVGSAIALSLRLGEEEKPLGLEGIVVRHTQEGFGVKFSEMTRNAKRILDRFLLAHSMESRATQYYL